MADANTNIVLLMTTNKMHTNTSFFCILNQNSLKTENVKSVDYRTSTGWNEHAFMRFMADIIITFA